MILRDVVALGLALASLPACDEVFRLSRPEPPSDVPGDAPSCTAGERGVVGGAWQATARVGDTYIVGTDDGTRLVLQQLAEDGRNLGLPIAVSDAGETLRAFSDGTRAIVTFNSSAATGWDQVATTSVLATGLEAPAEARTPTGWHSTRAVAFPQPSGGAIVAFRREIPDVGSYGLRIERYGDMWAPLGSSDNDEALGVPREISATASGYALLTDRYLLGVGLGGVVVAMTVTAGYDAVALVTDGVPAMVRASGGGIERVLLDAMGRPTTTTTVATGRGAITQLHASGSVVAWSEGGAVFVARGDDQAIAVRVTGSATIAVGVADAAAGPLVFVERDALLGTREVVAVQVCLP